MVAVFCAIRVPVRAGVSTHGLVVPVVDGTPANGVSSPSGYSIFGLAVPVRFADATFGREPSWANNDIPPTVTKSRDILMQISKKASKTHHCSSDS